MEYLSVLGFSEFDQLMLLVCHVFSMIGSLAHIFVLDNDYSHSPRFKDGRKMKISEFINPFLESGGRGWWVVGRFIIGAIIGLVIALYFVGALTPNASTVARVLALCVFAGYLAPQIWFSQEKIVMKIINKKIKELDKLND
ncbi:hypothetical protein [Candidatus Thiodiazotropha sp. CDECU1]|uniref:hypothetical protein n=1 Tax=Candidatus Thiodiazotropha sp. CDECU1 TaxID=3065865 RepID=UPI00293007FD|nr:hypothetical protein [Candidatus Thiodiazotropha sp. CDECU1]